MVCLYVGAGLHVIHIDKQEASKHCTVLLFVAVFLGK